MRLFEMVVIALPPGAHPISSDEAFGLYFGRERTRERLTRLTNELQWPLKVLDQALGAGGGWLCGGPGGRFTGADLNVSVVLVWGKMFDGLLDPFPATQDWIDRCCARQHCPYNSKAPPPWLVKAKAANTDLLEQVGPAKGFPTNVSGLTERYSKL